MNEIHTPPHFPTTTAPKQHPFSSLLFTGRTEQRPTMSTEAEMAALSSADIFRIDDLLDFSNEDLFPSSSSTTTTTTTDTNIHFPVFDLSTPNSDNTTTNFPHDFCVPNDDLAELEWLSNFVDDSFSNYPVVNHTIPVAAANTTNNITSVPAKARSKRSKPTLTNHSWTSLAKSDSPSISNYNSFPRIKEENKASSSSTTGGGGRKCTHCASERTPQWRTGPMGPKTLCNACGVRYKSGRLVPEYRPAASPTFMLTRHSNSHRKVLELRRQKEVGIEDCHEYFQHHHDYKIC